MDNTSRQSETAAQQGATDLTRDDLLELLVQYNEATDRLRDSHEVLRDEVARLRAELEQKNRELERRERLAMLGEMAAGVAHEIRNPLGGITLYADMLQEDLAALPEARQIVRRMQDGMRILNRIVDDMLIFARDLQVDPQAHRLADVVHTAIDLACHELADSGLRVMVEATSLDLWVRADASLVTRAVLNLVLNAAQAGLGRANPSLSIAAESVAEADAPWVELTLEDTCGGIDPEDLSRIFNPFFTRREQGTGLGLAIVHRIIEAHGGSIAAENNARGGATLSLTLPRAAAPQVEPSQEATAAAQSANIEHRERE